MNYKTAIIPLGNGPKGDVTRTKKNPNLTPNVKQAENLMESFSHHKHSLKTPALRSSIRAKAREWELSVTHRTSSSSSTTAVAKCKQCTARGLHKCVFARALFAVWPGGTKNGRNFYVPELRHTVFKGRLFIEFVSAPTGGATTARLTELSKIFPRPSRAAKRGVYQISPLHNTS